MVTGKFLCIHSVSNHSKSALNDVFPAVRCVSKTIFGRESGHGESAIEKITLRAMENVCFRSYLAYYVIIRKTCVMI